MLPIEEKPKEAKVLSSAENAFDEVKAGETNVEEMRMRKDTVKAKVKQIL